MGCAAIQVAKAIDLVGPRNLKDTLASVEKAVLSAIRESAGEISVPSTTNRRSWIFLRQEERIFEIIRLSAREVPVPQTKQKHWIDTIFSTQPYLSNVYPDETRNIGMVFAIENAEIEYFHLGVNPNFPIKGQQKSQLKQ